MASGHRKRKAAALRLEVLTPAGLTNVAETDRGLAASQNALMNQALYSSGGYAPLFSNRDTTILSDQNSNGDGIWYLLGYDGETSANAAGFIPSNTSHRYLPLAGEETEVSTSPNPVLVYSKDGSRSNFNQYYLPTANKINGTGSINFGTQISGAAVGMTKLRVYVAGAFPTGSVGAVLTVTTGGATPLITYTSSSVAPLNFSAVTASYPASFATAINAATNGPPTSGDIIKFTFPAGYAGLTASTDYTVTFTSSVSSPAPTGYNAYISGSTTTIINNVILKLVNQMDLFSDGTTGQTGSAAAWAAFATYVSGGGGGTNGVDIYARYPGILGSRIAISGSNNKIKKVAGVHSPQLTPYHVNVSFNTASMGNLIITYSSSATTATLNSFAPGILIYITGSNF
jgi:hypothetical protein